MKKLSIKKESNNIKKTAAKDYPTQYDAEFMVELAMLLQNISTAGTSSFTDAKNMINQMDKMRLEKWDVVFGDNSPWSTARGKKGLKVKWNKDKAKRLGL